MYFSVDSHMCRVDFFQVDDNGVPHKWYTTEAVDFRLFYGENLLIPDAFGKALCRHLGLPKKHSGDYPPHRRLGGMMAICLDPAHRNSHPICLTVPEELCPWDDPDL